MTDALTRTYRDEIDLYKYELERLRGKLGEAMRMLNDFVKAEPWDEAALDELRAGAEFVVERYKSGGD